MASNLEKIRNLVEILDDRDKKLKKNSAVLWNITEKLHLIKEKFGCTNCEAAHDLEDLIAYINSNGCKEAGNEH
jgi:hypothetical protein